NKTFDYMIPEKYHSVASSGMRVIVPFGPRKVTGFIIDITSQSNVHHKLKQIIEILDLTPVLTNELLQLVKWLAHKTLCLYITAKQEIHPQLLKDSYDKAISKTYKAPICPELDQLFSDQDQLRFSDVEDANISYYQIQQNIKTGSLVVKYLVKSKGTKKYNT